MTEWLNWIFHCVNTSYFVYPFCSWWIFGWFLLLVIMNNTAVNTWVYIFVWTNVSFPLFPELINLNPLSVLVSLAKISWFCWSFKRTSFCFFFYFSFSSNLYFFFRLHYFLPSGYFGFCSRGRTLDDWFQNFIYNLCTNC